MAFEASPEAPAPVNQDRQLYRLRIHSGTISTPSSSSNLRISGVVKRPTAGAGDRAGARRQFLVSRSTTPTAPTLGAQELTILTAWAEGVSEAAAHAPERIDSPLAEARAGATWRAALGLPEPSPRLADAMQSLGRVVRAAAIPAGAPPFDALLTAVSQEHPGEGTLDGLVRRVSLAGLEERGTRRSSQADTTR